MQQVLDVATGQGAKRSAKGALMPWYMLREKQRQAELARQTASASASSAVSASAGASANATANSAANATASDAPDAPENATNATAERRGRRPLGRRPLAFMHVPYNFGHTVEAVAMFDDTTVGPAARAYLAKVKDLGTSAKVHWGLAREAMRKGGEVWGHLNPDLQLKSHITGCPMFYTPQKYWPKSLAERYFGKKQVFGLLRDPYERLVAIFRGNLSSYGGSYPQFMKTCDVNGAVKQMMKNYLAGNKYAHGCTFVPQAEYFDGPHGIQLPVNNREFPRSINDFFSAQGYQDFFVDTEEILHVTACSEVWAGDLDSETRGLVQQVYARDFDFLCQHFGYCDKNENACLYQIPQMCPKRVLEQGYRGRTRFTLQ